MRMTALDAHAISSVRFHVRFSDAAGVDLMTEMGAKRTLPQHYICIFQPVIWENSLWATGLR